MLIEQTLLHIPPCLYVLLYMEIMMKAELDICGCKYVSCVFSTFDDSSLDASRNLLKPLHRCNLPKRFKKCFSNVPFD